MYKRIKKWKSAVLFLFMVVTLPLQVYSVSLFDDAQELRPEVKTFLMHFGVTEYDNLDQLNHYLQHHWLQANRERWELDARGKESREVLFDLLRHIDCIDDIQASKDHYKYALVLGATEFVMQKRLQFLWKEYERGVRFDQVVLLSGQRDLDNERENFPEKCQSEADLLQYLYEQSPFYGVVPYVLVDSPKILIADGIMRRPNTAKTIVDWIATHPEPGECLAISSQPFVGYQQAVVQNFLPAEFVLESAGPAFDLSRYLDASVAEVPTAVFLDNFAKWFYAEYQQRQRWAIAQ